VSKPQFKIVSYPSFNSVAPGAQVSLKSELLNENDTIPEGTRFQWACHNDPATTRWYRPSNVLGPSGRHWNNARWSFTGLHTVVLTVTFPDGSRHKYLRNQRVDNATNILRGEFDPAANDADPSPIETLKNTSKYVEVLKAIAKQKPPVTEEDKEKHENTIKNLEAYIFHLDDHLQGLEHKEAYQVDAIHLDEERSTRTVLKLWLVNNTPENAAGEEIGDPTWRLIDWTNPANRSTTGSYEESGDSHKEAIENLIEAWEDNNRYPEGRIRYSFIVPKYGVNLEDGFDTDGMSTWDEISKWLDYVALGAAVVAGVATLIAPVPGSRVASAAIWTSIFTSTGAATINIAQRHEEGFGNLKDDAFDGLSIVGNLFAGAGMAWKVGATVTSASKLGSGMSKAVLIGQISTDGLQGALLAYEHLDSYNQIMGNPDLLPDERLKKLLELFRSAAISGAMTYIAIKGSTGDLNNLNNNRTLLSAVDVETPSVKIDLDAAIEHSVPIPEGKTQVTTKVKIEPETRQLDEGPSKVTMRIAKRIENKFVNPDTFDEADEILTANRELLELGEYTHKYNLDEMLTLVNDPEIRDNYVTRIMNTSYLDNYQTGKKRGGYLGAPLEWKQVFDGNGKPVLDEKGKEVFTPSRGKMWSAGFDQTERGDKCPEQQAKMAGVNQSVNNDGKPIDQTMVIIDRKKYIELTESEMFRPTWENMINLSVRFAKDIKGSEVERLARIQAVMNDSYVNTYASVFKKAEDLDLDLWKEKQRALVLNKVFAGDVDAQMAWNDRFVIQNTLGANEHFLGTGFTKSLLPNSKANNPGIAEIFVVENKLMTIEQLEAAGAIKVYDVIQPVEAP
jgi:hypothetical protein